MVLCFVCVNLFHAMLFILECSVVKQSERKEMCARVCVLRMENLKILLVTSTWVIDHLYMSFDLTNWHQLCELYGVIIIGEV